MFYDGLISTVLAIPISKLFAYLHPKLAVNQTPINKVWYDLYDSDYGWTIAKVIVSFVLFCAVHWVFLKRNGQTIGKIVANTRIATMDGGKPSIGSLLGKRYAFMSLAQLIPVLGSIIGLLDVLMIFRGDRRCLHDIVAGTQVVKFKAGDVIP